MQKVLQIVSFIFMSSSLQAQSIQEKIKMKEDSIGFYQRKIKQIESSIEGLKLARIREDLKKYGIPKLQTGEELIEHSAMTLVYLETHEQAKWVAHIITPDILKGKEGRSNDFRPDPKIKTGSTNEQDYFLKTPDSKAKGGSTYKGFGFDRGHLAPSADFSWSQKALSESYFYSNMSPQRPEFNRDSWAKLEDMMRAYLVRNPQTELVVITGPVLKDNLPKIPEARNQVSIPEQYFKIALDLKNQRAIAFLMPNQKAQYPHESYATDIATIEKLTGIEFFAGLDPQIKSIIKNQKNPKPFLTPSEQEDVEPIYPPDLPTNTFNTVQAKIYINSGKKIKVCGTVVSTKLSSKGNIFINLDKRFPNQIFSISIFKDKVSNFSYAPEEFLMGKKIYVTGKVTEFNGTPTMNIENESAIEVLDE
ncbi:MAG: DNA/RNA non-specific endonuclease [Raineya sp.]|jgi:endonuclease G|nr:DNA/RNA non-specific endonuclease [Raineya sp.]